MKQVKTLLITFILVLIGAMPIMGAAITGAEEAVPQELDNAGAEVGETADAADIEVMTEAVQQSTLLLQLKQKLAQAQYRYHLLQSNVENAKEGLEQVRDVIKSLEAEIDQLKALISDTEKKILSVKSQIERKKMELEDLEEEVQMLELQLEDQKEVVSELMTLLYVKQDVYYDNSEVNAVKVLASPDSVSETLQKLTYLDLIEAENQTQIDKMVAMTDELTGKWDEIRKKREELDTLDSKLAEELNKYKEELAAQEALLEETKDEEMIYETMLASADEREDELLKEIDIYQENVDIMEAKFSGMEVLLNEDQQDLIDKIENDLSDKFEIETAADFLDLDWPIDPSPGLTAYFIDSGYVNTFGVQHYAIDIRANQGSNIFAPADGVVSEVVYSSDSTRYAYVRITHRKGVSTVYGHLSEVAVEVGDYVSRDQIIGLSGGMPGTTGAGVRTTGPHLHFEIWQDGIRVDPLLYLPLEEVPSEYLPDEYQAILEAQLEAEILELQEEIGF